MIIRKPHLYAKMKNFNQQIVLYGEGILSDTVKLLGRKMLKGCEYLFKQYVFPNIMRLAKETLLLGKKIFEETVKSNVKRILTDQTKKAMRKILEKNLRTKKFIDCTKTRIKNEVVHPTIKKGKSGISETITRIINGTGIKVIKNTKCEKQYLN